MENTKRYIPFLIRLIVAFLFIISAVAKMYPSPYFAISTFEVKQLYPMGFTEEAASYFSRILIGIELALGLLLLQSHFLRRLVIPSTILLLVVFIVHLTMQTLGSGNAGNCGCFGELLPMTPVEAIIKNVVAALLLIVLYRMLPKGFDRKNFWVITTITFASVLMVFMLAPMQARETETPDLEGIPAIPELTVTPVDSIIPDTAVVNTTGAIDTVKTEKPKAADEPAARKSAYAKYFPGIDKGKRIIGLFAPGCDHCMETAKQLTQLKAKNKDFPEISIIFMDEEPEKIPDFFKFAGAQYPYKTIDVITFWNVLGNTKDTPGVVYLWNGNIIKDWEGINDKKFVSSELMKLYKKPYSEIKK